MLSTLMLTRVATAWGVLFAAVHFYWAAGGAAGMNGEPAATTGAQVYIGVVAVLGLAAALIALGLERGTAAARLTRLARCAAGLLLAGVVVGVTRWIADGGLGDDGAPGVTITLYFLAGGALFAALGRRRATA